MPQTHQPISRVGLSLSIILLGSFMAPLLMHSSTLAIPTIAGELKLTGETITWFTLLNMLGNTCFVLPAGKLSDIYGRRRLFCFGVLVASLACLLSANAQSAWLLLIGRFLQGVGSAFVFGSSIALVSSIPTEEQKPRIMGIYIAVCYMGIVVGPLFGGFVIEHFHWRWVFLLPAIVLFPTSMIGFFFLNWERYGDRNTRVRLLDTSLYMVSLTLIAFAVFRTSETVGQILLAVGILSFGGFCWFQTKRKDPLLQVSLFVNNSVYATLGLTHFLTYCSILALPFTITLFLQYIKAIDAQTTGLILISQALLTAIVAPLGGWLSKQFRVRVLLVSGTGIICTAMILLAFINEGMPVWLIVISLALVGLGIGITDTQLLNTTMASVDEKLLGSASATLTGLRTMGGFAGVGIMSYLMGRDIGKREIDPSVYPQLMDVLHDFFMVAALLALFALSALVLGIKLRDRRRSTA